MLGRDLGEEEHIPVYCMSAAEISVHVTSRTSWSHFRRRRRLYNRSTSSMCCCY